MIHPIGECEHCGEERILSMTLYGNVCGPCEQLLEELEECDDDK